MATATNHFPAAWLKSAGLGETIACELRLAIVNGSIPHGEKLSENRIAADFGTSRSPVREALKTLSNEGLIRLERMGAIVLGMGAREIQELYDVRYTIESFVQERMAERDTGALIRLLEQIIDKMELAAKHRDIVEFSYRDFSFHEAIIAEAKHNRMMQLWKSIRQLVMTVMLLTTEEVFAQGESKVAAVIGKHRTIVAALRSNDSAQIQQGVREYFADSYVTLRNSLPED
ncbi:GntR family transcriptional regulator [Cohnella nanjingensis]|uniref:GntR family transcriptional regulator n=1 Tax=Cohnella nanjingensis TaxID=1387779 RepID=A0A7X0VHK3_9BACL|nr:GntR family transcriptional regulator [Cohnella nanjingensis]MBB6672744.1 GntR family transcriptional regulator [Cohnella nanjingensis]